jgi:hypothetical protein
MATELSGPTGGPVAMRTTNVLDVSHITDMAELELLERALNATIAKMDAT